MALLQCPECGGNVSSAATTCPHCGHPLGGQRPAPASEAPLATKPKSLGHPDGVTGAVGGGAAGIGCGAVLVIVGAVVAFSGIGLILGIPMIMMGIALPL